MQQEQISKSQATSMSSNTMHSVIYEEKEEDNEDNDQDDDDDDPMFN